MLKMLVFSATHHFIDLCASKVRYYREGGGGGGGGVEHPSHPPPRSATASASGFSLISTLTSYRRKARTFTYMFDCVNA